MRRVVVRRSSIHGRGVFALRSIVAGERILEYKGRIISWRSATRRFARDGIEGHTFYFALSDGRVIDGAAGGNSARWINHACAANCQAIEDDGRIFVHAIQNVPAGAELVLDYALVVDDPFSAQIAEQYACRCGAATCRGTMLGETVNASP